MRAEREGTTMAPACRVYCTYFDRNYLTRGLALLRSLRQVSPGAELWICCLDDETHSLLERMALPGAQLFSLTDLERRFPDLAAIKPSRTRVEYYFTCTPSVIRFVLDARPDLAQLTYLDADLYFFGDPEPLFCELEAAHGAVGIIAHRFTEQLKEREKYGVYNVGWLTFCRDERGMACLEAWRQDCLTWCYNRLEDGKFADQKYLDNWAQRFNGVVILQHKGANVALWNLEQSWIAVRDGRLTIAGEQLLFYHFHALFGLSPWVFHTSASAYGIRLSRRTQRLIYRPYLAALHTAQKVAATYTIEALRTSSSTSSHTAVVRGLFETAKALRSLCFARGDRGDYVVMWPWV